MNITEATIEEILHQSPWLIDDRFTIPKIKGTRLNKKNEIVYGRQVNVGTNSNRYVDLLLKDTRDDRPVLIEIKKGTLTRDNIGQILEYKSLIISQDEKSKEKWIAEFGLNYYAPKLILVGAYAPDEIKIAASIAQIEIREFDLNYYNILPKDDYKIIRKNLSEINKEKSSGNRPIINRIQWIKGILNVVQKALSDSNELRTLDKLQTFNEKKYYANETTVFIDIPIFYKEEFILGFYEFYVDPSNKTNYPSLSYSEKYIYFDFAILNDDYENIELINKCGSKLIKYLDKKKITHEMYKLNENLYIPIGRLDRQYLDNNEYFEQLIKELTQLAIQFYNEITKNAV
jgi:hypothetical protein